MPNVTEYSGAVDRPAPCRQGSAPQKTACGFIVLQLRWTHQFQFAGYYMAKELGLYRDAGLDVEIRAGGKTYRRWPR